MKEADTLQAQVCKTSEVNNTQSTRYPKHPVSNDAGQVKKYTTPSQFLLLHEATPETIANELLLDLKSFQKIILNSQKVGSQKDDMYKILTILLKLTKIGAIQILSEAFNSRSHQFCSKLQQYVMTINSQKEFLTVIELFDETLALLPQAWNFLPVNKLIENISKMSPLLQDNTKCISMVSTYQNEQQCYSESMEDNYCEYKNMSILPLTSEINNEMVPPKLRPNIVEGGYDSWEHYYDTQFKLLKEDFVASLRRGICDFRKEEEIQNAPNNNRVWKILDIRVYDNVTFTGLCFSTNGITLTIRFDCSKLHKVKWEHSKRLIYGSLLCFSCNNFETVMFATVVERDCIKLKNGIVTVKMESNEDILYLSLNTDDYYTMIESQAHYETYYHILRSLQTAESDVMPFTNIIIEANCSHVQPPAYMCPMEMHKSKIKHPLPIFDMYDALGMSGHRPQSILGMRGPTQSTFNVSRPECWPSVEQVQLDQSQLKAIRMALTQRVSVIQGPPGTGKTYIGLKIVQALLINRGTWDPPRSSPLLVVCYTNHALDQFLEGIIDLSESDVSHKFSVARVGGRCKSEKVAKYNIKNIEVRKAKVPKWVYRESRKIRDSITDMGTQLDYKYKVTQRKTRPTANNLKEFIAPLHLSQLYTSSEGVFLDSAEFGDLLKFWLSCEDMKQYENATQETEATADTTSSYNTTNSDLEKDAVTMSRVNVDNTISVVSQAEIAEAHRRIDEPATVFQYEETADPLDLSMLASAIEIVPLTKEFLTIPEGPLTHSTVSLIDDIFNLTKSDRFRLFEYWKEQYIEKLCNHLRANFEGYTAECKKYKEAVQQEDFYILDTVDLIGMTTTGAAKYQHIIQRVKPKIVIVEEAAEVLESYIVSCLSAATQQLILIGDHKQLRPSPNEYYLAKDYNLDISLFERLIRADIPHATLQTQHRMRPEIAGLVCPSIYPTLDNHESVLKYEHIRGVATNLHFFNHKYPETSNAETLSHSNVEEARLVIGLCDYFLKQDYSPSQITVLTTYTGQLLTLKSIMPRFKFEGVRVTVVDNFQGEENDIIILSLVRSNKNCIVGFLKIENRICVALSRARKGFYCFGNFDLLRKSCDTWENIVQYMESIGKLESSLVLCCYNHPEVKTVISTVDDFKNVPNGGCKQPCNALLDCGHLCTMICHIKDPFHQNYKCTRRCKRTCEYGHQCSGLCFAVCPPCIAGVKKIIPYCGHESIIPCSWDPQDFKCMHPCEKQLLCGHTCAKACGEVMCTRACMVKVQKTLHCKHSATLPCSKPVDKVYCWEQVLKTLPCDHEATIDCSQSVDTYECQFKMEKQFPDCKHFIMLPCSTPIRNVNCQEQVSKKLPCGHKAVMDCPQSVHTYKCQFKVERQFPSCKHNITLPCSTPIAKINCQKKVSKQLPCGHETSMKCSESADKHKCKVKVKKQFPNCEHSTTLACGTPVDEVSCEIMMTTKQLPCGHEATSVKCSEKVECIMKVEKKFPNCKHHTTLPCYKPVDEVDCTKIMRKKLPCGHKVKAKCCISVDQLKCQQKSKVTLECGHTFDQNCGKPIEKCTKIVQKKSPLCGHETSIKCCDDLPPNCTAKCTVKLLCGHRCTGNCTVCCQGRMHKACPFQMFPLPCGHHTHEPCTSIRFPPCEYNCEYSCAHHNCTHPCNQSCDPCKQPCSWVCKHYKCIKKCHEICVRPRCDQPCGHKLQCRHSCIGICGENCPRVCRICHRNSKFQKFYVGKAPTTDDSRYIQLSCNHLFEVKELDRLLDEQFKKSTVEPLMCPCCKKQIRCSHRYGNMIKKKKEMLRKLRDTMTEPVNAKQQAATIRKVAKFVPSHMHADYETVSDTLLMSVLKTFTQFLPPIFKKVSSLLTHRYENLIIENEADLYAYLKDMHKQYPESSETSTSLQELIVFFEKAPASAQKSHDVLSEALRIFILQMISSLSMAIPQTGEDYVVVKQLTKKLRVDQPRLPVSTLTDHFDRLQKMAEKLKIRINRVDLKCLQPTKAANFTNGVWIICSNGHLFCRPRGLSSKETWLCPDCVTL